MPAGCPFSLLSLLDETAWCVDPRVFPFRRLASFCLEVDIQLQLNRPFNQLTLNVFSVIKSPFPHIFRKFPLHLTQPLFTCLENKVNLAHTHSQSTFVDTTKPIIKPPISDIFVAASTARPFFVVCRFLFPLFFSTLICPSSPHPQL